MSAANSTASPAKRCRYFYDPESDVCYCRLDFMGFPGYCVGDDGTVWSKIHKKGTPGVFGGGFHFVVGPWKEHKQGLCRKTSRKLAILARGTIINGAWISSLKPPTGIFVHRLVLTAFTGPCPTGLEACHFPDTNPSNNYLENLRWDTRSANQKDAVRSGTSWWSKVTRDIAEKILVEGTPKVYGTCTKLAAKYKLGRVTIKRILNNPNLDNYPVSLNDSIRIKNLKSAAYSNPTPRK